MPKELIGVYLSKSTITKVDAEAEKLGLDRSPYIRMIIRNQVLRDD